MSRYRKIDVRIWADENFKALSPIPPCGQGLWFFLLTGPFTGPIPGLFRAGRAAMAEELKWPQKAFDKAFQEAFQKGMVKADFEAPLVWLPKALKYNKPESPNVITSWLTEYDTLPECELLHEAIISIRESICEMDIAYIKAFDKAFGKAIVKASRKAMPNQEQEQEQEEEKERERNIKREMQPSAHTPSSRFSPPTLQEVQAYCTERGNLVDPSRFIDFYTSKGWLVGKAKMRDWRAAVRNWEKPRDGEKPRRREPESMLDIQEG